MSMDAQAVIWFDGASRGNPGPAAGGAVIRTADEFADLLARVGVPLGRTTNNVAEYEGLIAGLKAALEIGLRRIEIRGDSKLVVQQISGKWRVNHPAMIPKHKEAKELLSKFERYRISHVYREYNAEADAVGNEVLDARQAVEEIYHLPERGASVPLRTDPRPSYFDDPRASVQGLLPGFSENTKRPARKTGLRKRRAS